MNIVLIGYRGTGKSTIAKLLAERTKWLTADIPTIMERIKAATDRPSLTGKKSYVEEVSEVLDERLPLYKAACDHILPTDNRTIEEIADEIKSLL